MRHMERKRNGGGGWKGGHGRCMRARTLPRDVRLQVPGDVAVRRGEQAAPHPARDIAEHALCVARLLVAKHPQLGVLSGGHGVVGIRHRSVLEAVSRVELVRQPSNLQAHAALVDGEARVGEAQPARAHAAHPPPAVLEACRPRCTEENRAEPAARGCHRCDYAAARRVVDDHVGGESIAAGGHGGCTGGRTAFSLPWSAPRQRAVVLVRAETNMNLRSCAALIVALLSATRI